MPKKARGRCSATNVGMSLHNGVGMSPAGPRKRAWCLGWTRKFTSGQLNVWVCEGDIREAFRRYSRRRGRRQERCVSTTSSCPFAHHDAQQNQGAAAVAIDIEANVLLEPSYSPFLHACRASRPQRPQRSRRHSTAREGDPRAQLRTHQNHDLQRVTLAVCPRSDQV
ncbi:hypothetical protein K474DRAFT_534130 [Panus rudis PR-1116 ss-1]|nr:hypothetical protein K474DRAFT_534130 [Panus rudis PR-1116 ss-1]